ncbi:hypothetical protein Ga0609869_001489 [Rhodovulum iodosum]|uniref:Lipoprotein n=1 Tax=Rhodovulum iodosum TaxID=68291 RepID=A0ABV3XS33_9RHOB|nr:hypothetical protein [Rhodovulum robiginosum]RSK30470.1 hypothetical protein EJA01_16975 [Rhodovulum robiginosum]
MKRAIAAGLFVFAMLAGCQTGGGPAPSPADDAGPAPGASSPAGRPGVPAGPAAACRAKGGQYLKAGLLGSYVCFRPTPDAGQACRRSTDCSELCLAETASCSQYTPSMGCFAILNAAGAREFICIE